MGRIEEAERLCPRDRPDASATQLAQALAVLMANPGCAGGYREAMREVNSSIVRPDIHQQMWEVVDAVLAKEAPQTNSDLVEITNALDSAIHGLAPRLLHRPNEAVSTAIDNLKLEWNGQGSRMPPAQLGEKLQKLLETVLPGTPFPAIERLSSLSQDEVREVYWAVYEPLRAYERRTVSEHPQAVIDLGESLTDFYLRHIMTLP
jgi:hypothetical protein